jgi:hypothetical protein
MTTRRKLLRTPRQAVQGTTTRCHVTSETTGSRRILRASAKGPDKRSVRLRWWDPRSGSDFIADSRGGNWDVSEREYCGVQWYPVTITQEIAAKIAETLLSGATPESKRCHRCHA